MPKFRVWFDYSGRTCVVMEAKNKEEAKKMYEQGDWDDEDEEDNSQNYELDRIEDV